MKELIPKKDYLDKLCGLIQKDGLRDAFIINKKLEEVNKQDDNDVVVLHSDNKKGKCIVYYGVKPDLSKIYVYEFILGKIQKEVKIENIFRLNEWQNCFESDVHDSQLNIDSIKDDVLKWIEKYKVSNEVAYCQFVDNLKVYHKYTGQIIIYYKEFNGESRKIKPIIRKHENVTLDELIEFGNKKSKALWNREFTCQIIYVKTYWKTQLGVYYCDRETIGFSEYMNAICSREKIFDTMLHEMVHWHLHTSGVKYCDEDFEFIEECLKVGCSLSQASSARRAFMEYSKSQ